MEKKLYTIIVHSENIAGLLNQVTAVFTRRQINIESLNVSASAAILIYMLSQRMRLSPSIDWRLKEDDAREMLFRWVMSSVKDSQRILERQFPL